MARLVRRSCRTCLLLLALSLLAAPRRARGEPVRELPPVVAVGQAEEVPAEAARRDPSGFSTAVEARPGQAANAAELAAAAPGVTLRDFGLNQSATISVRGSTSDQVVVLLDGLPLNSSAGGGTDLSTLPAAFIQRLSVARGAVGARYGAGALGGALLIETRKPEPGERRVAGEASYGSFGTGELSLTTGLSLGQDRSLLLGAFGRTSEGDFPYPVDDQPQIEGNPLRRVRRANNHARRAGLLGRYVSEGDTTLDLLVEADGGVRGLPGTAQAPTPGASQKDWRGLAIGRIGRFVAGMPLELRFGGRLGRLDLADDAATPAIPQSETYAFGELIAQKLWGRHAVEAGLRAGRESIASEHYTGPDGAHARALLAAWLADELTLSSLSLLPSARADLAGDQFGVSPKLGATLALSQRLALKANLGSSFRAPSFGELYLRQGTLDPNPGLRPEQAAFADLGATLRAGALEATASGFYTRYEDLILYELYAPMKAKPFNFGLAEVWGGEAELTARRGPVVASAGYTFARSANRLADPRYLGMELPYHPRHRLNARLALQLERLEAHAQLDVQSSQYTNRTNTTTLDARARFGAGASWLAFPEAGLWLHAELKNLFASTDQDLYGYPLPGRALYVSLRFDLDTSPPRSSP